MSSSSVASCVAIHPSSMSDLGQELRPAMALDFAQLQHLGLNVSTTVAYHLVHRLFDDLPDDIFLSHFICVRACEASGYGRYRVRFAKMFTSGIWLQFCFERGLYHFEGTSGKKFLGGTRSERPKKPFGCTLFKTQRTEHHRAQAGRYPRARRRDRPPQVPRCPSSCQWFSLPARALGQN